MVWNSPVSDHGWYSQAAHRLDRLALGNRILEVNPAWVTSSRKLLELGVGQSCGVVDEFGDVAVKVVGIWV